VALHGKDAGPVLTLPDMMQAYLDFVPSHLIHGAMGNRLSSEGLFVHLRMDHCIKSN
jgi:hypothetical protein